MKQIKFISIALALSFITLSSFKSKSNSEANCYTFKWFEYSGYGDPANPANYTMLMSNPECNGDVSLCAVYAKCDFTTWLPTDDSLFELAISSSNFTQPYTGGFGQVRLTV